MYLSYNNFINSNPYDKHCFLCPGGKVKKTSTVPQKVHNTFSKNKQHKGYKSKHKSKGRTQKHKVDLKKGEVKNKTEK